MLGIAENVAICEEIAEYEGVNNHDLSFRNGGIIAERERMVNIVWS